MLKRLRFNGLILFDNVLYQLAGQITKADATGENTVALRALNNFLLQDQRVETVMLSVGATLAYLYMLFGFYVANTIPRSS